YDSARLAGKASMASSRPKGPKPMTVRSHPQPPLGRRLFLLRQQAFLTQTQLARRAGVSPAFVAALAQGLRQDPKLSTRRQAAAALNVTGAELIGDLGAVVGTAGE